LVNSAKALDRVFPQDQGRNEALIVFALQNGLRENEYMHLRWKWLNLKDKTYNICIDEEFRPKHDHERIIHIPKLSFDLINKLPRGSDFIFPNSVGRKDWHLQDHRLKNIFKGAGLVGVGHDFHQIRKTCASYRLACGEPMQNLKAHLGHQSLKELESYVGKVVNPSKEIQNEY
jgi:integrase